MISFFLKNRKIGKVVFKAVSRFALVWIAAVSWGWAEEPAVREPAAQGPAVQESAEQEVGPLVLPSGLTLVSPYPHAVVSISRLWLIVKSETGEFPEKVTLNGEPLTWHKRFDGNVRVVDMWLDIGKQKLQMGDDKISFVLGKNEQDHAGPADWQLYHFHNMKVEPNPCMHCHEHPKVNGKIQIGALKKTKEACFECHEEPKLVEQHAKTQLEDNWQETCSTCHYLHASPYVPLLRKPKEGYLK